jgi:hypothetical protein
MTPKEVLKTWIDLFNRGDAENLSELYTENAINHQVANEGEANEFWIPGGKTSGGVSEAVMDFSTKPAFSE